MEDEHPVTADRSKRPCLKARRSAHGWVSKKLAQVFTPQHRTIGVRGAEVEHPVGVHEASLDQSEHGALIYARPDLVRPANDLDVIP